MQSFCNVDHYKEYSTTLQKKQRPKIDDEWTKLRKVIIALDGGRCKMCGSRYNLHVHHIRYRGEDNCTDEPSNLITLCSTHHDLVHTNKKLYQPKLFELVKKRKQSGL